MDTKAQFENAKRTVPEGWHWLLDILQAQVEIEEKRYLATWGERFEQSSKPFLTFEIHQAKEKFGCLRIYASTDKVEHNWSNFKQDAYEVAYLESNYRLMGYISCLETISANICEASGERRIIRNRNGWLKCLSDKHANDIN
jgi:hypothetical protein